jgi:proteic killer suppression protein
LYYYCYVIVSFKDKETEKIWNGEYSSKFHINMQKTARRKLIHIHSAINLNDLRVPPGNKLHELIGKRKGQHSIRINKQWRICFKWQEGNAYDVEIDDYH